MGAPKPSALQRMERERALLEAWTYVCSTPEFDTRKAVAAAEAILPDLVLNGKLVYTVATNKSRNVYSDCRMIYPLLFV